MYRIRFHGRGGQGVKTASRMLGTALFLEGLVVQVAPRYGAERRGAPIFAYVRADRAPIHERGVIERPDLVVVIDETLLGLPAVGVLEGVAAHTVVLVDSMREVQGLRQAHPHPGRTVCVPRLPPQHHGAAFRAVTCTAAAARLLGVVQAQTLGEAIRAVLAGHPGADLERTVAEAHAAFAAMEGIPGVTPAAAPDAAACARPAWVTLTVENVRQAAPVIHGQATAGIQRTGLWRTQRPVIDQAQCHKCVWICGTYCPDNALGVDPAGFPEIDLTHCKGCLICLAQCPSHAIAAVPEHEAAAGRGG